ncbi:MAG: hypothetical protein ACXVEC_12835 [Nocardioides sp.]
MSDERDRIDSLREQLDVEAQRYQEAAREAGGARGADRLGAVEVRLDEQGVLTQVRVDAAWRQRHEPAELAGAVLEAVADAAGTRARAWAEASIDEERPTPRARPAARTLTMTDELTSALEARRDAIDPAMLAVLGGMLDDLERGFDQAMADLDEQVAAPTRGRSSSGHAGASVLADGSLVGLELDERWLEDAHSFNIGREVSEAVADARTRAAQRATASLRDSGLLRLQHLASDPQALLRHLGVTDA